MTETYETQLRDCLRDFLAMADDGIMSAKNVTYASQFSIHDWERICREARNLLNRESI